MRERRPDDSRACYRRRRDVASDASCIPLTRALQVPGRLPQVMLRRHRNARVVWVRRSVAVLPHACGAPQHADWAGFFRDFGNRRGVVTFCKMRIGSRFHSFHATRPANRWPRASAGCRAISSPVAMSSACRPGRCSRASVRTPDRRRCRDSRWRPARPRPTRERRCFHAPVPEPA